MQGVLVADRILPCPQVAWVESCVVLAFSVCKQKRFEEYFPCFLCKEVVFIKHIRSCQISQLDRSYRYRQPSVKHFLMSVYY